MPENHFGPEVAARYDETSSDRFAPDVLGPTVDVLAELASDGAALEFAIGTAGYDRYTDLALGGLGPISLHRRERVTRVRPAEGPRLISPPPSSGCGTTQRRASRPPG